MNDLDRMIQVGTREPDAVLASTVAAVVGRVQARFPEAAPSLVEQCVTDAIRSLEDAPVKSFVPILAERLAGDALAAAQRNRAGDT